MGASMDALSTCDGAYGRHGAKPGASAEGGPGPSAWDEDVSVSCASLEDGVKSAFAAANRGAKISDEVLINHELLQYARQGNLRGLSDALDRGAWTETRRPLVMKPQKPDAGRKKKGKDGNDDEPANIGMTPIMFSAQKGSVDCVCRLLQAKAEVNAIEEDGWSALHFASKEGSLEICKVLLESRANPELVNIDEHTALDVADQDGNFKEMFTKLLKK